MNAIFFSDVHLRDSDSVKTRLFLRFLEKEVSRFGKVFILGDLFDVWPGTDSYLLNRYQSVIQVLREISDSGAEIHFIEGNHDFHLGDRFAEATGISIHPDDFETTLGGRRVYMVHGDLGNPEAHAYSYLRRVLRAPLVHQVKRIFPEAAVFNIGLRSSQMSRSYNAKSESELSQIRRIYRATAASFFENGYDVVLMGHTHLPDQMSASIEGRSCQYFNTGDWVKNFSYLEFVDGQFYTKTHPVKES